MSCIEAAGARSPELLAGEDRWVVDRGGALRLHGSRNREETGPDHDAYEDGDEDMERADPRSRTGPYEECHGRIVRGRPESRNRLMVTPDQPTFRSA